MAVKILLAFQSGFPINPSDLPWWAWLICAAVIIAFSLVWFYLAEENDSRVLLAFAVGFGLLGLLTLIVGVVRMVKWAWYD